MRKLENNNKYMWMILEEDAVGWYLTLFQGNNNQSSEDYLFDSLDDALEEVEERFGISKSSWRDVSRDEASHSLN